MLITGSHMLKPQDGTADKVITLVELDSVTLIYLGPLALGKKLTFSTSTADLLNAFYFSRYIERSRRGRCFYGENIYYCRPAG